MSKRDILIIIVIILIIVSGIAYYYYGRGGKYEINIERNYSTETERQAIRSAENLNYTIYLEFPEFNPDWSTNFINSKIINHYRNITNAAERERRELDIYYDYAASAKYYKDFNVTIDNNYNMLNLTVNDDNLMNIFHEGYCLFYSKELAVLKILRGVDEVPQEDAEFLGINRFEGMYQYNSNFTGIYLIEMYLSYSEIYSASSGKYIEIFQIVFLDSGYNVIMIILFPPQNGNN